MFFEVEHFFDASVDAVATAMLHPDYPAFLLARHDVLNDLSPQAREESAEHVKRRMHYRPKPAFDHIGPKKVPPSWFEFVEESTYEKSTKRMVFDNVPVNDKVARRFTNRGEILLEELAPGRTLRRARTELKLHNLPLLLKPLAGLAEQMIATEARKLLETEARVLNEFLASGQSTRARAVDCVP
jgi:hypothetical protein